MNDEFVKFLVKAKKNTYARGGEGGETILQDGGKEFIFTEDVFKYRDRYFGFNPFAGQEVVYKNEKVIWMMNYYGGSFSEIATTKDVYQFLKKALAQVKEDTPFRGPNNFIENDFKYTNESKGSIENFSGAEKIFYQGQEIYHLVYHGGIVDEK